MSVIAVQELMDRSGSEDQEFVRNYTRTFRVRTDSTSDDAETVLASGSLPQVYEAHPNNNTLGCINRDAKNYSNFRTIWKVTCEYSNQVDPNDPPDPDDDPLNEPPEISWTFDSVMITPPGTIRPNATLSDDEIYDAHFENKAGEPFDPQPQIEEFIPVLTVTVNEPIFRAADWFEWVGVVNDAVWQGAEKHTLKFLPTNATRQVKEGFVYWRVTYSFKYNPRKWDLVLLNAGSYYTAGGEDFPFLKDGQPYIGILNSDGGRYEAGVNADTEAWIRFENANIEKDFTQLPIFW